MKKLILSAAALAVSAFLSAGAAASALSFDAAKGIHSSFTTPLGKTVNYTAYTGLAYAGSTEDSAYQTMNVFVPEGATQKTPIFFKNGVGGYMAAEAGAIDPAGVTGRALEEGLVVAMPGARGRNSRVTDKNGKTVWTGRAPAGLLDLKAAVRYLRKFDKEMPGDAEKIISDGTSAGGAMSALLGATGNHPDYGPLLKKMGAADERDDIFAVISFCPIIDLEHADMAYEWLYSVTNGNTRPVTEDQKKVSEKLAGLYPAYLESLHLKTPDGSALDAESYRGYLAKLLIESAQAAKDAGADIPENIGFTFSEPAKFHVPLNGGVQNRAGAAPAGAAAQPGRQAPGGNRQGETIIGLDLDKYLNYVVTTQPLKTAPAFDSLGVAGAKASGENEEFGDGTGSAVNFTAFSLREASGKEKAEVPAAIQKNVRLLNPMHYIADPKAQKASYWYIRHGARDRDTAFTVPVNLALSLQNQGIQTDFRLPWNRPHSGDYALNEMFSWIKRITR